MILLGIITCLLGITVVLYGLVRKKMTLSYAKTFCIKTVGGGMLMAIVGFLSGIIANYDISYASYKIQLPGGYFVALIIFVLLKQALGKKGH